MSLNAYVYVLAVVSFIFIAATVRADEPKLVCVQIGHTTICTR